MFKVRMVKIKALLPRKGNFRYEKLGRSNNSGGHGVGSSTRLGKLKSLLKLTPFSCMMPASDKDLRHGRQAEKKNKNKIMCSSSFNASLHLPKGSCAVYVGPEHKRFVLKTCYLTHPALLQLLRKSEEEFGFDYDGGLLIPCSVAAFEKLVELLKKNAATPEATRRILEPTTTGCCG